MDEPIEQLETQDGARGERAGQAVEEQGTVVDVEEELLIEEISIDGMCGVY